MTRFQAIEVDAGDYFEVAQAILLWPFHEAPEDFKRLSQSGGDEDFLAFVPDDFFDSRYFPSSHGVQYDFLSRLKQAMGVCNTEQHEVEGGFILIGTHS